MYLTVSYEDVLNVHADREIDFPGHAAGGRIGQVAPSVDGWAVYQSTVSGRIATDRIGTEPSIEAALKVLAAAVLNRTWAEG